MHSFSLVWDHLQAGAKVEEVKKQAQKQAQPAIDQAYKAKDQATQKAKVGPPVSLDLGSPSKYRYSWLYLHSMYKAILKGVV